MELKNLFSLKGRSALIIGGSGLLGTEISLALAEKGSNVVISSRNESNALKTIKKINNLYPSINTHFVQVDLTDKSSILNMTNQLNIIYNNKLDILVNCGWSGKKNTFETISFDDWEEDIDISLNGVFFTIKNIVPLLKKGKDPNILNIASMYGHVAPDYKLYDNPKYANPPSYGAAKAGIIQLTKYLASFLSKNNIRVNCISPGPFPYKKTQLENPDFIKRLAQKNPLNRIGNPYEIKGASILLCSRAGSYINGQNICVDGGWGIW